MNIVFSLVLLLGGQEYILDYNMSREDCVQRMEALMPLAPNASFECVADVQEESKLSV